jgi:hypothetical protein
MKLAYEPVGVVNAVVIAPMTAIHTAPEVDPTRSTANDQPVSGREVEAVDDGFPLTSSPTDPVGEVKRAEGADEQDHVEDEDDGVDVLDAEILERYQNVVGHEGNTLGLPAGLYQRVDGSGMMIRQVATHWRHCSPMATSVRLRLAPRNSSTHPTPS